MSELFLIRGLPGSGKSTFAKKLLAGYKDAYHIENDMYHMRKDKGGNEFYAFNADFVQMAAKWCLDNTYKALTAGMTVIVSNTFVQKWQLNPYIHMAERLNVPYTIITMNGDFGSIHNVPEETMARMRRQWEEFPV